MNWHCRALYTSERESFWGKHNSFSAPCFCASSACFLVLSSNVHLGAYSNNQLRTLFFLKETHTVVCLHLSLHFWLLSTVFYCWEESFFLLLVSQYHLKPNPTGSAQSSRACPAAWLEPWKLSVHHPLPQRRVQGCRAGDPHMKHTGPVGLCFMAPRSGAHPPGRGERREPHSEASPVAEGNPHTL